MAFDARIAQAHIGPQDVVHGGAGAEGIGIAGNEAAAAEESLRSGPEGLTVALLHRVNEAGNLHQGLGQVAQLQELPVGRDILAPAGAAAHLHIPDGSGIHLAAGILIEVHGGGIGVGIQAELLDQEHPHQGIQVAVVVVVLAGVGVEAGVIALAVGGVHRILKLLVVLADVLDGLLAAELGALHIEGHFLTGMEAVGLVDGIVVELQQPAAGEVVGSGKALGVGVALAVGVGPLGGNGVIPVAGIGLLIELLHVGDIHRVFIDVVFLAEQIGTAILSVVVQIHPVAVGAKGQAHLGGQILEQLVVHLGGVAVAGQQHPGLPALIQA